MSKYNVNVDLYSTTLFTTNVVSECSFHRFFSVPIESELIWVYSLSLYILYCTQSDQTQTFFFFLNKLKPYWCTNITHLSLTWSNLCWSLSSSKASLKLKRLKIHVWACLQKFLNKLLLTNDWVELKIYFNF